VEAVCDVLAENQFEKDRCVQQPGHGSREFSEQTTHRPIRDILDRLRTIRRQPLAGLASAQAESGALHSSH
jgi:hypothetical protein